MNSNVGFKEGEGLGSGSDGATVGSDVVGALLGIAVGDTVGGEVVGALVGVTDGEEEGEVVQSNTALMHISQMGQSGGQGRLEQERIPKSTRRVAVTQDPSMTSSASL